MKKNYHLCFSGGDEILFRDQEDYRRGFNCFALALYKTGSTGLVDAIMSTHAHFVAQSEHPDELMYMFRMAYIKGFNHKYKRKGTIGEKCHFEMEVVGLHHMLAAMSYTLRNPVHHGVAPIPYAYPHSSANVIFQKEMGKHPETDLLSRSSAYRFLGKRTSLPDGYKMDKSGLILRESVLDIVQVETLYNTPRTFHSYMTRKTGEESKQEQEKGGNQLEPMTLEVMEKGIDMHSIDRMLTFESGRADYRKISDIELCTEIDSKIVPSYGKASVYHLSDKEKYEIANTLHRTRFSPRDQLKRCLNID